MPNAGIDVGAKTVKIAVVGGGKLIDQVIVPAGQDSAAAVEEAWQGLQSDVATLDNIIATGSGRKSARGAQGLVSEVAAAARGAVAMFPAARTIIDLGAEEARAVAVDEAGGVVDFAVNDKCAAGTGAFAEAMARALEVSLEEMGRMSLGSAGGVAMNAQCAVFAESELVTLVHAQTPKEDMARAIHDAISDRIVSLVRRVGIRPKVALIGGMARNVGFVDSLQRYLKSEVLIPQNPEIVSAFGAALLGAEGRFRRAAIDEPGGRA